MIEFKGTRGDLELKFVNGICIGIGTVGDYSQITANTILPDSDKEYKREQIEIESNMRLYAASPDLFRATKEAYEAIHRETNPSNNMLEVISTLEAAMLKALN